jgi:hypothetical protein
MATSNKTKDNLIVKIKLNKLSRQPRHPPMTLVYKYEDAVRDAENNTQTDDPTGPPSPYGYKKKTQPNTENNQKNNYIKRATVNELEQQKWYEKVAKDWAEGQGLL